MRLIACLLRYQCHDLAHRCRAQPMLAISSLVCLLALYLGLISLVLPKLGHPLQETYSLVLEARGQTDATFFVALVQLVVALLLTGPILMQASLFLENNQVTSLFHLRVRAVPVLLTALQWPLTLVILAVQILLAPLTWGPFLHSLPLHGIAVLGLFQICLLTMNLTLFHPYFAFGKKMDQAESGTQLRWLAACLYYALVTSFGRMCQTSFSAPSRDQVPELLLRCLRIAIAQPWILLVLVIALLVSTHLGAKKLSGPVLMTYGYP